MPFACCIFVDSAGLADFAPQIKVFAMQLRIGYELIYSFPQPTPIILVVNVHDSRASDIVVPHRPTTEEALVFLLGSRYCETDLLSQTAWQLFGGMSPGYPRVQAICDYVHNHIAFNYQDARPTRSAWEALDRKSTRLNSS